MSSESAFAGGTAVVTGGGSGLGRALAAIFAREGMHVVVADIDIAKAKTVAVGLPNAVAQPVDLGDAASVAALRDAVTGPVSVLCANVGVQEIKRFDQLSFEEWRWLMGVNVLGTVATVQAFLPKLRAASGLRRMLLTASTSGVVAIPRLAAYTASKYAIMALGETLRLELAPEGIGVTLLMPSGMDTTHLESSAAARPTVLGPSGTTEDDLAVVGAAAMNDPAMDLATPEHAARHVVAALLENRPYLVTHGSQKQDVANRFKDILTAFEIANEP